ncbi:MAG TPA: hypothetical protein PLL23_13150 [Chitinophagaceae bacterium]|nr:hypothetical protein [Chitinophagaceae bacterium]
MKKIFTLFAALFLTVALFAADRRPVIKLNNNNNYKVVIDGRTYFGDDINIHPDYFLRGKHTVKVYEMKRGFFGRTERLVNATTFFMDRDDIIIRIDRNGGIIVREEYRNKRNYGYEKNNRDRYDNDRPIRRF